jgi:hypothetical protein
MRDSVDRIEEVGDLWRQKWRELAEVTQGLHREIEDAQITVARLRVERDEARGALTELRRLLIAHDAVRIVHPGDECWVVFTDPVTGATARIQAENGPDHSVRSNP